MKRQLYQKTYFFVNLGGIRMADPDRVYWDPNSISVGLLAGKTGSESLKSMITGTLLPEF